MEERVEFRAGALIILAILGIGGLLYVMGELRVGGGDRVKVQFAHSGAVPKGAPVKLAGVRVGRVRSLELFPDRRDHAGRSLPIEMEVEIDHSIFQKLGSRAQFVVATQGPLGEPFLEIESGPKSGDRLKKDAVIRGIDPPRMDLLSARLFAFLEQATALLSEEGEATILARNLTRFAEQAEAALQQGGSVTKAANDFSTTAQEFRELAKALNTSFGKRGKFGQMVTDLAVISSQLRKKIPPIAQQAERAVNGAALVTGSLTAEDGKRLQNAIARYAEAGVALQKIAARAEHLLRTLEEGKGTIGGLAKDPQVYQDLRDLISDLKKHPWKVLWKDD